MFKKLYNKVYFFADYLNERDDCYYKWTSSYFVNKFYLL